MTEFVNTITAKTMRSGIDIAGEITKVSDVRNINLKAGGTTTVADAILTDADGDITLTLWGDDIALAKVGSKVTITNGYTNEFKGEVSLTKGKFGQMSVE